MSRDGQSQPPPFEPVAIVGQACVLPGALGPQALWEAVRAGRDLLAPAPAGRWRLAPGHALGQGPDRAWSDRGGYVTGFEQVFDPASCSSFDPRPLDPLFQWLLHVSREAMAGAGVEGGSPRIGAVFGNLSFPTAGFARLAERVWLGDELADAAGIDPADPRNRFSSGLPAHLVARELGLGAGAFCLDAACASSLYAIKLACDRLHDRSADVMLAGAVSCADDLFIHVGFSALQAMSRTGRSRPFHRDADGLLPAEGAGAVVLKRLRDAEAAGDRVLGVIRAVGLSNDGRGSGLLAPSEEGQVRAMAAAWRQAGLSPADVSLIECHATGTAVGDRTEVRSMARVFGQTTAGDRPPIPIGSLKSNFGHAITAAGVAGLIKVLGALAARERPPTLHADEPVQELAAAGSPFRLLTALEPWPAGAGGRPRIAAVSAFGFGGCNAHLVVQEHQPGARPRSAAEAPPPPPPAVPDVEVAVVGLGAAVGEGTSAADLERSLTGPLPPGPQAVAGRLTLPARASRFPPRDLALALAQQSWLLAVADEALCGLEPLPAPERIGVFVGMGCDPEVARYGARWRLRQHAAAWGVGDDARWTRAAQDACSPPLEAAGVLGTLPNLPANRLSFQLDARGQGFTVSAEELSGVRALEIAARALRSGELDLALVGAADFCCEAVHRTAAEAVGLGDECGDAALMLVLMRAEEARGRGLPVLAVLDPALAGEEGATPSSPADEIEQRFGRPHAALGLLQVAAAALACRRKGQAQRVVIEALGGQRSTVALRPGKEGASSSALPPRPAAAAAPDARDVVLLARRPPVELPALSEAADPQRDWARAPAPRPDGLQPMPPAPSLRPLFEEPASWPPPQARAGATSPTGPAPPPSPPPPHVLAWLASQQSLLARVHRQFVESQAAAERAFLETRARMAQRLLELGTAASTASGSPWPPPPRPGSPASVLAAPSAGSSSLYAGRRPDAPAAPVGLPPLEAGRRVEASPVASVPDLAGAGRRGSPPEPALPGPKLDRRGLLVHASGRISEIYGPEFAGQDSFERQVRMPEPPLLLADRLLGIDAVPRSMGKGRLWTETDVSEGAWYLHDGRMPAGLMIEAGQADLMLISYLGIDFLNRGERVYRLLGCDLTYHGELPVPGETLRYEIRVDGHAQQGAVRLFFFQYDCRARRPGGGEGSPRLSVRNGQAGFFSDAELDASAGVLFDPATAERKQSPRLDPPAVRCERTRFDRRQLESFSEGRPLSCFGPGFERTATHTRTPRIGGGKMLLLEEVTDFIPGDGGPWGRGYLRAVDRLSPDDWFFRGHFKADPCMPGTLMLEGCLQAMAIYLAGMGYTLDRDGWRFEPVPEETYRLRCRGQVTPRSKELVYEVFVEEVEDGPTPTLWADLLCTVDGLKAFHCRRMGLRLVPGWPLDSHALAHRLKDARPVAQVGGFAFGARSLLACAWGRPSEAFGEMYRRFDGPRRVPRLPGPPYLFVTRIARVEGELGGMQVGSSVEAEYDVPPEAWYFDANGAPTMPFCVLLEAALQPCGWLASYVGSALADQDLFFRNLDGDGTVLAEVLPDAGTLVTRVTLTNIARSGGMIIETFDVSVSARSPAAAAGAGAVETPVYRLKTAFGFFPTEALAAQRGLPVPDGEREALAAPSAETIDLGARPDPYFRPGHPRLGSPFLLMLPRVTGVWPDGGKAKLGRFRAEMQVDPSAWFFKAHFFQDPVQPGSLGLEAMLQVLQAAMIRLGVSGDGAGYRFEPIAPGEPLVWKYRGQVRPHNQRVVVLLDLVRVDRDARLAVADASLWVDGLRIYEARGLAMRVVRAVGQAPAGEPQGAKEGQGEEEGKEEGEERLSLQTLPWLGDHRPTWTVPALPLMSMVDRLCRAAARASPGKVVSTLTAKVHRWLPVPKEVRLTTQVEPAPDGALDVTLLSWREAAREELSRFEPVASARIVLTQTRPEPPVAEEAPPGDLTAVPDPYQSGALFHGPALRLLRALSRSAGGRATATVEYSESTPRELVLDALTHCIPHDSLHEWDAEIAPELVAYPTHVEMLSFFDELPRRGALRVDARYLGRDPSGRPRFGIQAVAGGRVVLALELRETLFPKGPLGNAEPARRLAFLRDRRFVEGVRLSQEQDGVTRLTEAAARSSDWLPGTLAGLYSLGGGGSGNSSDAVAEIAAKEHVACRAQVHPATVRVDLGAGIGICDAEPLNAWPLLLSTDGGATEVRDAAPRRLELAPVREYWERYFGLGRWPVEDLYYGLAERFVRRVRLAAPEALAALRGRGVLYLANHQVAVESLMFSVLISGITGVPTVTLAKAEHRTSWLGRLIQHAFSYPGAKDPGVITFFDRAAQGELPKVVLELAAEIEGGGKSAMVHVEGTRALSCRAPVVKMSGAFLDMALAVGAPVVPVRFVGGLPAEPAPARLEFPLGMGRQDLWVGAPIGPAELEKLSYKERKERVIAAINGLGPEESGPLSADAGFAAAAEAWSRACGASPEHAVLHQVLRAGAEARTACEETLRLLEAIDAGDLGRLGTDARGRWLRELAQRLAPGARGGS